MLFGLLLIFAVPQVLAATLVSRPLQKPMFEHPRALFNFKAHGLFTASHLRYRRLWFAVGVLLVLVVLALSIMSLPSPVGGLMAQDKLLHVIAYAGLMGWFSQIFRHDLTRLILVFSLIFMGIGVEFIQGSTTYRQFDVLDMIANTSGVILAWALAYTWVGNVLPWFENSVSRALQRG